jgi:hypothetical protein
MTTYYISGPMRGKPDYNRHEFRDAEAALRAWLDDGHVVINPAGNPGGEPAYTAPDLRQVLDADVLVLLPGWRDSEGARHEVELATWADKRFLEAQRTIAGSCSGWNFAAIDAGSALEERAAA